jgi:hypothetical protein
VPEALGRPSLYGVVVWLVVVVFVCVGKRLSVFGMVF